MFIMSPSPIMGGDISLVTALACLKRLLVSGSDTIVTVLGMTSVVSTLSHWLGLVFQATIDTLFLIVYFRTCFFSFGRSSRSHNVCLSL